MASPELSNTMSTLHAQSVDYLADPTHQRMKRVNYIAAETPAGLLIEQQNGCLMLTAEHQIAQRSLVAHILFRGRSIEDLEVFESTESNEGWGKSVHQQDIDGVAARMLTLFPEAS
jgi:hypothetical protein